MRNLTVVIFVILGACSNLDDWRYAAARNEEANAVYPQSYKADITSLLRTYLNDPTNIREAFISEPVSKTFNGASRYVVCVRYNAKKSGGQYAGSKENLFTFRQGRLDRVVDSIRDPREAREARELCKDLAMVRFTELEHLTR